MTHYEATGWYVEESEGGYLTKRRRADQPWTCVYGGTTATVVVLVDGRFLINAHVGDSSAMLGG